MVEEVAGGNITCEGVTSDIVPGLEDNSISGFRAGPHGLHPVGNFQIWIPRENLPEMMSFMRYMFYSSLLERLSY